MLKRIVYLTLLSFDLISLRAQVNLQTGAATFSLPIFNWQDDKSRLNSLVALSYNSENGLRVNDVATDVGQGWSLVAGGVITRVQVGEPDDQYPFNGSNGGGDLDITRYPPGLLYGSFIASKGCPDALTRYPIYKSMNQVYTPPNDVAQDRQLDYFSFRFNGKVGMFVLNPSNIGTCISIGDTKIKLTYHTSDLTGRGIRTRIDTFYVQDVDGLIYKFCNLGLSKVLKAEYCDANLTMKQSQPKIKDGKVYHMAGFDQNLTNPWIVDSWYLSEIDDVLTHTKISFSDTTMNINSRAGEDINYNQGSKTKYCLITHKTSISQAPEIRTISFPDGHLVTFNYGANRVDLTGEKVLSSIDITYQGRFISKYLLNTSYFIFNRYGNPSSANENAAARLCLRSVQKIGPDLKEDSPPYTFDYYRGSSTGDNFVPPPFFYAKDIWGFFNGSNSKAHNSNSGIQLTKSISSLSYDELIGLCFIHDGVSGVYLNPNPLYAENGLLRQIIYPTGGTLTYTYAQNSGSLTLNGPSTTVGGVHVSQTSSTDGGYSNGCGNPIVTQYSDVLSDGVSPSLWGLETPANSLNMVNHYAPEYKYYHWTFPLGECRWKFQYPGIQSQYQSVSLSWIMQRLIGLAPFFQILSILGTIKDIITAFSPAGGPVGLIVDLVLDLIQLAVTCIGDQSRDRYTTVYYNTDLNAGSALPAQFKRVEIKEGGGGMGKTIQEFTSDDDYQPWVLPNTNTNFSPRQRFAPWAYGLPKKTTVRDSLNRKIKETENIYNFHTSYNGGHCVGVPNFDRTLLLKKPLADTSCKCFVTKSSSQRNVDYFDPGHYNASFETANIPDMTVDIYDLYTGRTELDTTYERIFRITDSSQYVLTTTGYVYNDENYEVCAIRTQQSDGKFRQKNIYYTIDYVKIHGGCYNLTTMSTTNPQINTLVQNNIISLPVETNEIVDPFTSVNYTYDKATVFTTLANGDIKPLKTLEGRFTQPAFQNTPWTDGFNDGWSTGAFSMPAPLLDPANPSTSFYKTAQTFTYGPSGNLTTIKDEGNRSVANIYDYSEKYLVASIINADSALDKPAYSSFETNYFGGWTFTGTASYVNNRNVTGLRDLNFASTNTLSRSSLNTTKAYILSFWSTAAVTVSAGATLAKTGPTLNGFIYYEYNVAAGTTSVTVSTSATVQLDELRLYPANARMRTVCYDPVIGKVAECDENNRITHYEYDNLGRLRFIKDESNNIVKMYEYNNVSPSKQNGCPGTYSNNLIQEVFTKNSCGANFVGSDVVFSVAANTYTSTISQADADAKAENYILTTGQTYANTNGTCIPIYYNTAHSQIFTTQNCADGYVGGSVTYTVPAGRYYSTISQADADNMALDEDTANGQAYANEPAHAVCNVDTNPNWIAFDSSQTYCLSVNGQLPPHLFRLTTDMNPNSFSYNQTSWQDFGTDAACPANTYYNAQKSQAFTRNNCPPGYTAGSATYTVPPGKYSSTVSQAAADQLAQNDINANGQNYANSHGTCTLACTWTANAGWTLVAGSPSSDGTNVSFYIVFKATNGNANWQTTNTVATVGTGCRPTANRIFNMTQNGTTWKITVTTAGQFQVLWLSGTLPPANATIGLTNGSYPL